MSRRDSLSKVATRIGAAAVDAMYPKRCAGCGRRGVWVCVTCHAELPHFQPPWCIRCGIPTDHMRCACDDLPVELSGARAVAPFRGWLREAIICFKYQHEWARADHLGDLVAGIKWDCGAVDALVPVPLHPKRHRQRGYNQAELLARRVSAVVDVPVLAALHRSRHTLQQVGLDATQRRMNVADAFGIGDDVDVRGMRLALVDDVLTTGSTMGACAKALVDQGATEVWAVTLAREMVD